MKFSLFVHMERWDEQVSHRYENIVTNSKYVLSSGVVFDGMACGTYICFSFALGFLT